MNICTYIQEYTCNYWNISKNCISLLPLVIMFWPSCGAWRSQKHNCNLRYSNRLHTPKLVRKHISHLIIWLLVNHFTSRPECMPGSRDPCVTIVNPTEISIMYSYVTWRMTTEISVMYGSEGVKNHFFLVAIFDFCRCEAKRGIGFMLNFYESDIWLLMDNDANF